mmetsp:Transcript_13263/g.32211  ORF Transcript_13263/g.32211 Transcript_13263/m.32211 type:complete len:412 (+) Transcript_13263:1458-2693(+)
MNVAVTTAGIGGAVLSLGPTFVAPSGGPELVSRGGCAVHVGWLLEFPSLVGGEILDDAVPLPRRRSKGSVHSVRCAVAEIALVPGVTVGGGDRGSEAIHTPVLEAVPLQPGARGTAGGAVVRVSLDTDVDAAWDDVLRVSPVSVVGAFAGGLLAGEEGVVGAESAVVSRHGVTHVGCGAAVHLYDLLVSAHAEGTDSVGSLGGDVDGVRGEADVALSLDDGVVDRSPLLDSQEDIVNHTVAGTPLLLLLEMGRAERVVRPEVAGVFVGVGGHVITGGVGVAVVHRGFVSSVARAHGLAGEVVGFLNELAGTLHHSLGGFLVRHEGGHLGAVVVNVRDVRAGEEGGTAVDGHGVRDSLGDITIRLSLPDDAHGGGILEHSAHAVGDAHGHVAGGLIVLTDGGDGLKVSVGEG